MTFESLTFGFFRSLRRSASSLSHYTSTSSSSGVSPGGPGPPRCDVIRLGTPGMENNRLLYRSSGERIPCLRQAKLQAEYVPKLEHVRELVSAYNEQILKRQHNPQEVAATYADDFAMTSSSSGMLNNQRQQMEPIYVNIL